MRLRFWLGSALAAVLLVVGVQGVAQATSRPIFSKASEYTAAEYFDGIYFGVGPVAERVPQLHEQRSPGDQAEAAEAAAELRAHIEAESPRFLDTFAAAVVSGDQVVVRDALADGAERIEAARQATSRGETEALRPSKGNDILYITTWAVTWQHQATAFAHAGWSGGGTDLHMDEAAGVIATELAGR